LNEIAQHKIKIYEFPECDDDEEKKLQKKLRVGVTRYLILKRYETSSGLMVIKQLTATI
jgi:hypothetical protein